MNLIIIIGIFILFAAWNIWWSSPQNIGKRGERRVARKLDWLSQEYITLNDLLLPTRYGTTQIDHVVVSPYGIFVIETKNYKGWIFGHENSEEWRQSLLGKKRFWGWSSEQHKFRSPIRQNEFEDRYNLL
ncbi:MAG: NERD domain-containing protein [Bacteroidales bacterium]|nr:NERD domain-containing protein [Bacteroidales bacterium]